MRATWLDRAASDRAGTVKLFVRWAGLVGSREPENPRDPSDPAYNFELLDKRVTDVSSRGFNVLLGVQRAPTWAEGKRRAKSARPGTWKPHPGKLRDLMTALASRYSGYFGGLPRVRDFQLWNEPNLYYYLTPQREGGRFVAAQHYTRMLRAGRRGLKSVSKSNRLVTAGLAPYGGRDEEGNARTRPLRFWREVFCLKGRKRLRRRGKCERKATFDIFAHHAINTSGPPTQSAFHPDDASSGDLGRVRRTLRAAERQDTAKGRKRHPLWVTEYWWWSRPPSEAGVGLMRHARYVEQTLYLAWRARFEKAIQLRIRDVDPEAARPIDANGLYFADGSPKPAAQAFRFPFVAERRRGRKVTLWGKAPKAGRVVVERKRRKGWKRIKVLRAGRNRVFVGKVRLTGQEKLRARAHGEQSLPWKVGWT